MDTKRFLLIAEQRGSCMVLSPIAKHLADIGHKVDVIATGTENEAQGFGAIDYEYEPAIGFSSLLDRVVNYDIIIAGLTKYDSADVLAIRAGNKKDILTVGVLDQASNYDLRFSNDFENFPEILSVMDEFTLESVIRNTIFDSDMVKDRGFISGWTAFDNYPQIKKEFTENNGKQKVYDKYEIDQEKKLLVFFSALFPPGSPHFFHGGDFFDNYFNWYHEANRTSDIFMALKALNRDNIDIMVAPHPKEDNESSTYLQSLNSFSESELFRFKTSQGNGFEQLCLAADYIVSGPSTALTAAWAFNKSPVLGVFYPRDIEKIALYPPARYESIPLVHTFQQLGFMLDYITSESPESQNYLRNKIEEKSPDFNASKRLVNHILSKI